MRLSLLSPLVLVSLLACLLVASGLGLVWSTHQVRGGYARLQELELQRWQLQEEYTRLLLEINTWAAPHRINQIASENLSMLPPDLSLSRVIEQ
ncbi:MAG: cell division protein FtsL [Halieaceae bacterium]|jgi:cell division protein FtsL